MATKNVSVFVALIIICLVCYGEASKNIQNDIYKPVPQKKIDIGMCECGAFYNTQSINKSLIIKNNPINITCNYKGRQKCFKMCNILGQFIKSYSPELLCESIPNVDKIKPLLFIKMCKNDWILGNVKADSPMCCNDGKLVKCTNWRFIMEHVIIELVVTFIFIISLVFLIYMLIKSYMWRNQPQLLCVTSCYV